MVLDNYDRLSVGGYHYCSDLVIVPWYRIFMTKFLLVDVILALSPGPVSPPDLPQMALELVAQ